MSYSKVFGAGLLTLAVVGGAATYLNSTLSAKPATYALVGVTIEQSQKPVQAPRHAEMIVTDGQAS